MALFWINPDATNLDNHPFFLLNIPTSKPLPLQQFGCYSPIEITDVSMNTYGDIPATNSRPLAYNVDRRGKIFEFRVVGHDLRIAAFRKLSDDDRSVRNVRENTAYLLEYSYVVGNSSSVPSVFSVLFLGAKPRIFVLYEDVSMPDKPVGEWKVCFNETGEVYLKLVVEDAEADPDRHWDYIDMAEFAAVARESTYRYPKRVWR
jgi:hypothetical protein